MRRVLFGALIAALALVAPPAGASAAEPCPPFDGAMTFQNIQGAEDPEEYCWEVNLGEGQALRQVDDQEAEVYYTEPEHHAFSIVAELAHDADGTEVPTTLAVVQPNVIVLTVHHRAGDIKAARRALLLANCQLGPVCGHRRRGARIAKQYRRYGAVLPAGTEVGVRLAR